MLTKGMIVPVEDIDSTGKKRKVGKALVLSLRRGTVFVVALEPIQERGKIMTTTMYGQGYEETDRKMREEEIAILLL